MAKVTNRAVAPRMTAEDRAWRARDDLGTLRRAAEIQADRSRVTAAQAEAKKQMQALQKVAGKPASGWCSG